MESVVMSRAVIDAVKRTARIRELEAALEVERKRVEATDNQMRHLVASIDYHCEEDRAPLIAHVAQLRAALQPFADRIKLYPKWKSMLEREAEGNLYAVDVPAALLVAAEQALAVTTAASLAAHDRRVKAEVLREVAKQFMDKRWPCIDRELCVREDEQVRCRAWLEQEADRLEGATGAEEVQP